VLLELYIVLFLLRSVDYSKVSLPLLWILKHLFIVVNFSTDCFATRSNSNHPFIHISIQYLPMYKARIFSKFIIFKLGDCFIMTPKVKHILCRCFLEKCKRASSCMHCFTFRKIQFWHTSEVILEFYVSCTMHCNIIIQWKPIKYSFSKLVL